MANVAAADDITFETELFYIKDAMTKSRRDNMTSLAKACAPSLYLKIVSNCNGVNGVDSNGSRAGVESRYDSISIRRDSNRNRIVSCNHLINVYTCIHISLRFQATVWLGIKASALSNVCFKAPVKIVLLTYLSLAFIIL